MTDALIGSTGFVGSQLARQHNFEAQFHRTNVTAAEGRTFGTLVCAAAPGSMFTANRHPEADAAAIDAVISALSGMRARRMVLVSTIAVLARFDGRDTEDTCAFQTETPYGVNRRRLEVFCQDHFESCLVVRLPALFGPGLRKNFIFDILNLVPAMLTGDRLTQIVEALPAALAAEMKGLYDLDKSLGLYVVDRQRVAALAERANLEAALIESGLSARAFTNPHSTFQYYDMTRLWGDITRSLEAELGILHIAPEPLRAGAIHLALTGQVMAPNAAALHHEDMHTRNAGLWGRKGPYTASAEEVLADLQRFVALEGGAGQPR